MNPLFIGMRPFGEAQSKATRAFPQSGQYHIIVESRVRLTDHEAAWVRLVVGNGENIVFGKDE